MKKIAIAIAAATIISSPALAEDANKSVSKPITLTEAQMDSITAAGYGKMLIELTRKSFGQFIGPAKKNGTATHSNYAGGVKALVEAVMAEPPHPIPGGS